VHKQDVGRICNQNVATLIKLSGADRCPAQWQITEVQADIMRCPGDVDAFEPPHVRNGVPCPRTPAMHGAGLGR
jgi:hypothetical protein